jgi:serine/threonine protein kinase
MPSDASSGLALSAGSRLDELEIAGVIHYDALGIVYLAHDRTLDRHVAVKEYLPRALCERDGNNQVHVRSERHHEIFETGRQSFVDAARLLARFDHAALVKVYRVWEANGTAYKAMPYHEGRTLRETLDQLSSRPDERWLLALLRPLTEALEVMHAAACYPSDISPQKIWLLASDRRPMLLSAGPARKVTGEATQAGAEQYAAAESIKPGPWSDVYSLAAVVHFAVTGKPPPPANERLRNDPYLPLAQVAAGRYSKSFLVAIDRALIVDTDARTLSMAALRSDLGLGVDPLDAIFAPPARPAMSAPITLPTPGASTAPLTIPTIGPFPRTGMPLPPVPSASAETTIPPTVPRTMIGSPPHAPVPPVSKSAPVSSLAGAVLAGPKLLVEAIATGWRRMRTGVRADASTAAAEDTLEPMRFAFSAPSQCEAGSEFSLLFSAYVESLRGAVEKQMRAFAGPTHRSVLDIAPDRGAVWLIGTPFKVRLSGRYFTFDPAEAAFEWSGSRNDIRFAVTCASDAPATAVVTIWVGVDGVAISTLPIEIRIRKSSRDAVPVAPATQTTTAPRSVFASYSSKDVQDVARSLSTLSRWAPRLDIFQDCLDLKANAAFKPQLKREIASRDVFMLFWSRNAARSSWVRWEYKTALSAKRKDAILPMPLEDPAIAPPPPEFSDLHLRDRFMLAGYALSKVAEIARRTEH